MQKIRNPYRWNVKFGIRYCFSIASTQHGSCHLISQIRYVICNFVPTHLEGPHPKSNEIPLTRWSIIVWNPSTIVLTTVYAYPSKGSFNPKIKVIRLKSSILFYQFFLCNSFELFFGILQLLLFVVSVYQTA